MVLGIELLNNSYILLGVVGAGILSVIGFSRFYIHRKNCPQGTKAKDVLVVGLYPEYKPYEFINEQGEVDGFDIDVVRELAKRMKKKVLIKNISFESLIPAVMEGEVDIVISGISITPDRLSRINMIPYHGKTVRSYTLLFWREIPEEIKTIHYFKNFPRKKIAVQVGTIQEDFISKFDFLELKPMCSLSSVILDIRHGDSVAAIVKPDIVYRLQSEYPKLQILEIPLEEKDWVLGEGIGVRKDNQKLIEQLNDSITKLKSEGVSSRIHAKWLQDTCCDEF